MAPISEALKSWLIRNLQKHSHRLARTHAVTASHRPLAALRAARFGGWQERTEHPPTEGLRKAGEKEGAGTELG